MYICKAGSDVVLHSHASERGSTIGAVSPARVSGIVTWQEYPQI